MEVNLSEEWVSYYRTNASGLREIPWEDSYKLSVEERQAISKSIAEFQKGESSEGKHLLAAATRIAKLTNDPAYKEATILFIKEEQRHAKELLKFMKLRSIPSIGSAWPDSVFRTLRHLGGMEVSICVLVTAEIIAQSYYPALKKATEDPILIKICQQIISDEDAHVKFQTERIFGLRNGHGGLKKLVSLNLHRFLFWGTLFVVWVQHKSVYLKAEMSFKDYWSECWELFTKAEAFIHTPHELKPDAELIEVS